jgi:hypothetical protein
MAQGSLAEE